MHRSGSSCVLLGLLLTAAPGACTNAMEGGDPGDSTIDLKPPPPRPVTRIQEKLLYVAAVEKTEPGATASPDAIFTVDVEPGSATYGQIIHRTDMSAVGDELHHFGYDWDNQRLIVNGLFSQRTHILNVANDPRHPTVEAVSTSITD